MIKMKEDYKNRQSVKELRYLLLNLGYQSTKWVCKTTRRAWKKKRRRKKRKI